MAPLGSGGSPGLGSRWFYGTDLLYPQETAPCQLGPGSQNHPIPPSCCLWDGVCVPGMIPNGKGVTPPAATLCHINLMYDTTLYLDISTHGDARLQHRWDTLHPAPPAASLHRPLLVLTLGSLRSRPHLQLPPAPAPWWYPTTWHHAGTGDIS